MMHTAGCAFDESRIDYELIRFRFNSISMRGCCDAVGISDSPIGIS